MVAVSQPVKQPASAIWHECTVYFSHSHRVACSMCRMMLLRLATAAALKPECRVLSLSGGGSFGAFEAGVLSHMTEQEPGLNYDFMLGVSAGALNTGYLSTFGSDATGLQQGVKALQELWASTKSKDVWSLRPNPFKAPPGLLTTTPLEHLLERVLSGRRVQRNVTIGTTNLATGATARHDEINLASNPIQVLLASAAIPAVFPPVALNGTQHVDGGNSANVLTIHGIDRCDLLAKSRGMITPPTIQLDVVLAMDMIEQVTPAQTMQWGMLDLAAREFLIAKKQLFDHQLRFRCPKGRSSRIHMTVHTPNGVIEKGTLALLNFDKGKDIWAFGHNVSNVNVTTFDFCL